MKYRHHYHAGNFADVHKHVALLALLAALGRKDKGFLYLETHAGRGAYSVPAPASAGGEKHESEAGIARLEGATFQAEELRQYLDRVGAFRAAQHNPRAYPGSPLLAASALRPQDRGIAVELLATEARALELALGAGTSMRVETGDGFGRIRAHLPPKERRGLTFIDPPYEETRRDFERVTAATSEALRRFESGIVCVWYPIKNDRDVASWKSAFGRAVNREVLFSELWLYPRDSRVGLNGSGLATVNPPFQFAARADVWLWELHQRLDRARTGGAANERFTPPAAHAAR
ncbi:MAG TPA: 23S rRNA (adenine(2030)-N(6))-methyltransferase RlmJ [Steroidobacteraceae bacterium]|nr:23S rRNA (adenine(2030)-N(6))-methyltransferase RlmJ [Steroidobacteraceae bacterium]